MAPAYCKPIIINATNVGRNINGIGRYSLSLSRYLLKNWDYPFQIFINKKAQQHLEDAKENAKIRIVSGLMSPDNGFRGHLLRLFWTNQLSVRNKNTLLFNTSQLEGALYHRNQIITVHDIIPLMSYPRYFMKQFYYFKHILPIVLRNCQKVITDSHYIKHLILNHYDIPEQKIAVIYAGIDDCFLTSEKSYQKKDYILYVGRLSPTKNIEGLIKAFEILTTVHNIDVVLKVTGRYEDLNITILPGLRKKIDFLGNVSDTDLLNLYRDALFFVFPSFYEGFGIPPLEAMACGCPTVVSHAASLPEVCGDAAHYIDPADVESIAAGMLKVATDTELRKQLIEKGINRAALFSWDRSAREHISIFQEVLNT